MKTADTWFEEYGESHKDPTNKLIHWICEESMYLNAGKNDWKRMLYPCLGKAKKAWKSLAKMQSSQKMYIFITKSLNEVISIGIPTGIYIYI